MNEVIINAMINKLEILEARVDKQNSAVSEITETVANVKEQGDQLKNIATIIQELQNKMTSITFPVLEMQLLKSELAINNEWRANPRKEKVQHIHTGGKLMSWTIGVGIAVVITFLLWWNTYSTLRKLEMHDTLWRTIKVTATKDQLKSLQQVERDYTANPKRMKQLISEKELKQQQILEAKQNQAKAEQEAENWKKAAGDMQNNKSR